MGLLERTVSGIFVQSTQKQKKKKKPESQLTQGLCAHGFDVVFGRRRFGGKLIACGVGEERGIFSSRVREALHGKTQARFQRKGNHPGEERIW